MTLLSAFATGCGMPKSGIQQPPGFPTVGYSALPISPVLGDSPDDASRIEMTESTLRVVAYNVHLLPSVAAPIAGQRTASDYRAKAIGRMLASHDLIGLSEAFHPKRSRALVGELQARVDTDLHIARGPARSGRHLIGSGLLLISRYPILDTATHTYRDASRFWKNGLRSDGFAAKGILFAKIQTPAKGRSLDCFLTHLESQLASARDNQIQELAQFIQQQSPGPEPKIILGDFNVAAPDPASPNRELAARLCPGWHVIDVGGNLRAAIGTSDAIADKGGARIDYIFLVNPSQPQGSGRLRPVHAEHLRFRDSLVPEGSLSDHLAIASQVELL